MTRTQAAAVPLMTLPKPIRIQQKRTKGWKMPDGAVSVARPGPWGNMFVVTEKIAPGRHVGGARYIAVPTAEDAVECFRLMLTEPASVERVAAIRTHLRGKSLACWCKLDQPCHASVLLEIANAE